MIKRKDFHFLLMLHITGDLIEMVHSLQSLDVSQIKDKKKQTAEAKHIHLRKRKALADLFKYLQNMGNVAF